MSDRVHIKTAGSHIVTLPVHLPEVAAHVSAESSQMDILIHQINEQRIYSEMFVGRKDLVFLDLGANIGLVSLYAVDVCKRIVAFEPAPKTFSVLRKVCFGFNNIELSNLAISDHTGTCSFFVNDINTTANSSVNTAGTRTELPCITLSHLLEKYQLDHVDVCKVDIEGGEGLALSLQELTKAKPIIKSYYIETHNCPTTSWEYKLGMIVHNLSKLGYYKMKIDGTNVYAKLP